MGVSDEFRRGRDLRREVALLTHPLSEPRAGAAGPYRLLEFDELGSTNDATMARLRAGDPGGLLITATRQSGGRGRQGRAWQSPPGNLYASLGLRLSIDPRVAPQLGFVAGVALAGVLRGRLGGDPRLKIKWPNDMVFGGAKLAGMLLESTLLAQDRIGCVIGFGVNCVSHPVDLPYLATDLAKAGDPHPDPRALVADLAAAVADQLRIWDRGERFAEIRKAWLALAMEPGTALAVELPDRQMKGAFQGIDATGRLLLGTNDGLKAVDAGDVFLSSTIARI